MNEKFTKNIINQLFTLVRKNENSEEMGICFTVYDNKIALGIHGRINTDWRGGTCEYEYAINFRDWTEDEISTVTKFNEHELRVYGYAKGDINYYNSGYHCWQFIGNIYEMNADKTKGGITKVKTTEPTEEKTYRIFFPENEIIVNMNKLQYDFCVKLYEETDLFDDNFIDLQV